MRSSKSRSRNKNNRNRPSGNIVNRVFDSSGPEGKVRGTPQQIIDKYNQLARDAQLANDRVATENFQQHAEHYLRLLSEAQREMDARREEQERQNRERQAERDRERQERIERQEREAAGSGATQDPTETPQPDVFDVSADGGLVETPENKVAEKPKSTRKPRSSSRKKASDETRNTDKDGSTKAAE
jgi:sRNA-binding protein